MSLLELLAHPLVAGLLVAVIVAGSSAACGAFAMTLRNHRLLTGEDVVDSDDGLIGAVQVVDDRARENERRSRANARALATRTDGGRDE
ncbi:hypothetical protein [Halorarius litoreus]|uniref:hypothetical protein n=1 Tax=Halorarius litoreus TaxID=2962676 RepID=UPI0020CF4205|nr:hypothetical protein [Halorarius litoreus]